MASKDEIPELPREDSASEKLTHKARKRDQMVRHNQLKLLIGNDFYSRESVGQTNLRNRRKRTG